MDNQNYIDPESTADIRARKSNAIRINGMELDRQNLSRELAASVDHISELEIEIEKVRTEHSALQAKNDGLKEEIERLQEENAELRDATGIDPDEVIMLRQEQERLTDNNMRLEEMISQLNHERAELMAMLPNGTNPEQIDIWRNQRVAVLVDVQNMYYSAKKIYNSKISFHKLLPALVKNRKLVRAIAYTVEKEGSDQEKFYEVLRRSGFEIKRRDLIVRSDGSRKGDWDMGIAIDAISIAEKVDVVILVTGDGDFVALVSMLKGRGVRVEVASFHESTSDNLIRSANEHYNLDDRMLVD